jgi:hypothetical protein
MRVAGNPVLRRRTSLSLFFLAARLALLPRRRIGLAVAGQVRGPSDIVLFGTPILSAMPLNSDRPL